MLICAIEILNIIIIIKTQGLKNNWGESAAFVITSANG